MKLILKIGMILLMPVMATGCVIQKGKVAEPCQQMDGLNIYMLSHGHNIPNNN